MPMKNPPHPGRIVKSSLDALDLSIAQAAEALEVSRSQLNRVVKGDSAISADMAVRLEAVIGSTADHWLRMQVAYDLSQVGNSKNQPAANLKRATARQSSAPQPSLI